MRGYRGVQGLLPVLLLSCSQRASSSPDLPSADPGENGGLDIVALDAGSDAGDLPPAPVPDVQAATKAFRLYYVERVERAVTAFQRFQVFGDASFGMNIGRAAVSRQGQDWSIVPGPNDNNAIGWSTWTAAAAWRVFGTRPLALGLFRMLRGLAFLEAVSGHPGVTCRHAYPGWTVTLDGFSGTETRTRNDMSVASPLDVFPTLRQELITTLFGDGRFTYREDPSEFFFRHMPAAEPATYAITYSFSMLPHFLRVSDCCASLMRTPAPYPWEGAFWSNHNSRDNMPDLTLGFLTALDLTRVQQAPPELIEAANLAWAAAHRVGDLVQAHGDRLMTVDEHHPYDQLVVAGAIRPDGETENEDLGSMSDCAMAYAIRSLSSEGLSLPLPPLELPGSIEYLIPGVFDECTAPTSTPRCDRLDRAWCGKTWGTLGELHFLGEPWLDLALTADIENPGTAETLIGSFQDDYAEQTLAMLDVVRYAEIQGDEALLSQAREALASMTALMRRYADILYPRIDPDRWRYRRYEAALFDAWGGLSPIPDDLDDFRHAEQQMAAMESWLEKADTEPGPMLTPEAIQAAIDQSLPRKSQTVQARYAATWGQTPPVRPVPEGYEARFEDAGKGPTPWTAVDRPRHQQIGGVKLLEALPLCLTAPTILDCTWAKLGCARPDLDGNGTVDGADRGLFETLRATHAGSVCGPENGWCGGADLDRTGQVDATDDAFLSAAQGCWYKKSG